MSVPAKIKVLSKIYNSKLSFLYFCIKNLINLATKNDTKKDINPQKCIYSISYILPAQYVKKELKLVKITEDVEVALTLSLGKFMLSQSGVRTILLLYPAYHLIYLHIELNPPFLLTFVYLIFTRTFQN